MSARTTRWGLARWLVSRTSGLLGPLGVSVAARIVGQLLGVALLVIAVEAAVHAAAGAAVDVPALAGWLAGLALLKAGLRYLEHYAGHWVAFAALQRLRELFFDRLVPQAPAATAGRAGAELTQRATRDIDRIEVFFAHTFPPAVSAVLVPAAALTWLAVAVDSRLAAVLAIACAAALVLPLLAGSATWAAAGRVAGLRGAVATHVGDDVQGIREVLAFGAEESRLAALRAQDTALTRARTRSGALAGLRSGAVVAIQLGSLGAVLTVGAAAGVLPAAIAVTLAVAVGLWGPTRGVDEFVSGLEAAFAATARVREIVEAAPLVADPSTATPLPGGPLDADLSAVTFAYPGRGRAALTDVTMRLRPGAWSYLVGVSGSGKSSVAGLLLRGWDPQEGIVRISGVDVRLASLDELRSAVALAPPQPTILAGSLASNLRLAAPHAGDAELHQALRVACLDAWAAELPQGLETEVEGRGASGGQLQRLGLARALLARPRLLILDECLSQLDADTAARVRARLAEARPGMTILEITHRADLIPDQADVVVLDCGRVVAEGPAGQLRSAGGPFAHLEARVG